MPCLPCLDSREPRRENEIKETKIKPIEKRGCKKEAGDTGSPKEAQRSVREAKERPREAKERPREPKGRPKRCQKEAKERQRGGQERPKEAKPGQRRKQTQTRLGVSQKSLPAKIEKAIS